jgi:hypothetical protein
MVEQRNFIIIQRGARLRLERVLLEVAAEILVVVDLALVVAVLADILVLAVMAVLAFVLAETPEPRELAVAQVVEVAEQVLLTVAVMVAELEYWVKALLEPEVLQTKGAEAVAAVLMVEIHLLPVITLVVAHTEEEAGAAKKVAPTEEMGALAQFVSYGPAILAASHQLVLGIYEPLHRN